MIWWAAMGWLGTHGDWHLLLISVDVDSTCLGSVLKFTRQGGVNSCSRRNTYNTCALRMSTTKSREGWNQCFWKREFMCVEGSEQDLLPSDRVTNAISLKDRGPQCLPNTNLNSFTSANHKSSPKRIPQPHHVKAVNGVASLTLTLTS